MIEILAILFSIVSVWLTAKKNIYSWVYGIVGCVFYAILFFTKNDIANFLLQPIFIVQSIFGIINWNKKENEFVENMNLANNIKILFSIILTTLLFFTISHYYNGNIPIIDSLTTSLSIHAMYLLSKSKIESWILWIIADILYIYFFILNDLYLSSGLYTTFLLLSIYGYYKWNKIKIKTKI